MLKAVNLLKVLSVLLFLGVLLVVYAYSPIMVKLRPDTPDLQLHKENFFYFGIAFFAIINIALLAFQRMYEKSIQKTEVKAWVRGFTFVINLYLAFIIGFIGVINNTNHLKPEGWAYLNYLGPILIFVWIVGLIYLIIKKE